MWGGDGNDTMFGGWRGEMYGEAGNDRLFSTGNSAINGSTILDGGAGNDELHGSLGHDILIGGDGDDFLYGAFDADSLSGGAGNDRLVTGAGTADGGDGNDEISGGTTLLGGAGDDILDGGGGAGQTLTGGADRDRFIYQELSDAYPVFNTMETITDFQAGAGGDWIDISLLLDSFGYSGADPFADGYVRLVQSGPNTVLQVDNTGGGDGYFDFITLSNVTAANVTADNWIF
jgi:Ca2+-binding RTX toxin-like protein